MLSQSAIYPEATFYKKGPEFDLCPDAIPYFEKLLLSGKPRYEKQFYILSKKVLISYIAFKF